MLFTGVAFSATEDLLAQLKTEISRKPEYDQQKEAAIIKIKNDLKRTPAQNKFRQYDLCGLIYNQYRAYQYDSAFFLGR